MASRERDDESSQNPPGRRRLSANSRNRAVALFTSALARFGLGRDKTSAADEREDRGQGQSEEEKFQDHSEISSTTDASEKPEADGPRVQTGGEEEIESSSSNAEEERRSQHPENTLSVDNYHSSSIDVISGRPVRRQGRGRESSSPDVAVKEEPISSRSPSTEVTGEQIVRQPRSPDIVVKQEPVSPTAAIDPITGWAVAVVIDLTGDDDNDNANPEIRRISQLVHDQQLSKSRPIKRRRTSPPPSSFPTSRRRRRRRERTDEPTPDLSYMPDAKQEESDESPNIDLYDIPTYPGSPAENAEARSQNRWRGQVKAAGYRAGLEAERGRLLPSRLDRAEESEENPRSMRLSTFEGIKGKQL
ncbi:hypothetical protein VTN02DRAFT_1745 [Thermoascus thermophilus]